MQIRVGQVAVAAQSERFLSAVPNSGQFCTTDALGVVITWNTMPRFVCVRESVVFAANDIFDLSTYYLSLIQAINPSNPDTRFPIAHT